MIFARSSPGCASARRYRAAGLSDKPSRATFRRRATVRTNRTNPHLRPVEGDA
jgi:hypothetical protein